MASKRTPPPSVFLQMDTAKAQAKAAGLPVIDLSIGASDLPPPPEALQALRQTIDDPTSYGYCLRSGTQPLLQAATDWYEQRYGVALNPRNQALSLIGSQEGLAHLLMAIADPGEVLLLPEVAYPSYFGAAQVAGLTPYTLPLGPDRLPVFSEVPNEVWAKAKALLLNYPNNPTSAVADQAFWHRALQLAQQHQLLLIHDNPYLDQVYEGQAVSPLALPNGPKHIVELYSFSKSYHLAGFRLGFALGNAQALAALEAVKGPIDFNQYLGIQRMGIACLSLPSERLRQDAAIWHSRTHALQHALAQEGWSIEAPKACMYLWAKLPHGLDDLEFCQTLVRQTGVALAPGRGFGPGGYGYVRFAVVQPQAVLQHAASLVGSFIRQYAV